jgi:transcriptional regulator with XRE-family HTH domain
LLKLQRLTASIRPTLSKKRSASRTAYAILPSRILDASRRREGSECQVVRSSVRVVMESSYIVEHFSRTNRTIQAFLTKIIFTRSKNAAIGQLCAILAVQNDDLRPVAFDLIDSVDLGLPPDSLADRLRIVQAKAGFKTDREFAQVAGVARSTMSSYLSGDSTPRPATLHRISSETGVDYNWLSGKQPKPDPRQALQLLDAPFPEGPSLLDAEVMDDPANFYLLAISLQLCRAHYAKAGLKCPALKDVLIWISGPYAVRSTVPDHEFEIKRLPEPAV